MRAFNFAGDSAYTNQACGTTPQTFGLAVVRAGTLTRYLADCTSKTYRTGDAFIEAVGVHMGRNEDSSVPVELYVTYIDPAGSPLRIEADPPPCAASLGAGAS